jgi:UDP-GlcNAc:undecaprenyl-phosphate GlcNAc-1-phosphate transferase
MQRAYFGKEWIISHLMLLSLLLPVAAFAVSALLTRLVHFWAIKVDFCAHPRQDRYHRTVIALGGGIGIFWTITLFLLAGIGAVHLTQAGVIPCPDATVSDHIEGFFFKTPQLWVLLACTAALHLLGLWDDMRRLGAYLKLAIQFAVAIAAAVFAEIRIELFIENPMITTALSVLWIVGIINVFNFLDNMDGCSSGMAMIVVGVLLTAAVGSGQIFITGLGLLFIGAVLGFWIFNFPPAKIFMGDCGSLVVGFWVALLSLKTTYYHQVDNGAAYSVLMPLLALAVPLYDFVSVTFLRLKQGKSPLVGDTQHFSHRLGKRGLSDRQVAMTLYLATICTGLGAITLRYVSPTGAILIFIQTVIVLGVIAILETTGNSD